jgi:uncharacterized OB-fold protein
MLSPVKLWRNQKNVADLVGKTGRIVSWTIIRVPTSDFTDQAPYPVVLVDLDASHAPHVLPGPAGTGKRIIATLVDWTEDHLKAGQQVVAVVRRVVKSNNEGVIPYGIKVKPID